MGRESDDRLTEHIYSEYGDFLEKAGIPYHNNQNGFHVFVKLKNIKQSFTHVCRARDGEILLTDYCGNCYTGVRKANRVAKAVREKFPDHDIIVEHFGSSFELDIYYQIRFTTIEALHEAVLGVAEAADVGAGIGYDMLGEDFER